MHKGLLFEKRGGIQKTSKLLVPSKIYVSSYPPKLMISSYPPYRTLRTLREPQIWPKAPPKANRKSFVSGAPGEENK